jgi:hypothetical protein
VRDGLRRQVATTLNGTTWTPADNSLLLNTIAVATTSDDNGGRVDTFHVDTSGLYEPQLNGDKWAAFVPLDSTYVALPAVYTHGTDLDLYALNPSGCSQTKSRSGGGEGVWDKE